MWKGINKMSYKELSETISKPWVDTDDIMQIACCSKNSAIKIRVQIEEQVLNSGKKLPPSSRKFVPTKLLIEYLGLDIDYIFSMAERTT